MTLYTRLPGPTVIVFFMSSGEPGNEASILSMLTQSNRTGTINLIRDDFIFSRRGRVSQNGRPKQVKQSCIQLPS